LFDDNGTASGDVTATIERNNLSSVGFFIVNQTPGSIDATTNTFDETNNFRIEDKVVHALDDANNGLVTWVANSVYVTTPGVGSTDSSIQRGLDAAPAGYTVNVEGGTYAESLTMSKAAQVLKGATGTPSDVVIDPTIGDGITVSGDNVTIRDLRITNADTGIVASNLTMLTLANLLLDGNTAGGSLADIGT